MACLPDLVAGSIGGNWRVAPKAGVASRVSASLTSCREALAGVWTIGAGVAALMAAPGAAISGAGLPGPLSLIVLFSACTPNKRRKNSMAVFLRGYGFSA